MVGPPPDSWAVPAEAASARRVVDGLWSLRLPLPWPDVTSVNAFALARDDGGITLVDCGGAGDESCWRALVNALGQAGFEIGDVRELVLTHYHSDHAGMAARIVDEVDCDVLGHPDHAHFTDAMLRPREIAAARERRSRMEGVPDARLPDYRTVREEIEGALAPVLPDVPLRDGDAVDSALGPWRVLETPGHAPSHVSLHQPEASVLILGDVISGLFLPYIEYGYTNDPVTELRGSLRRLAQLGPLEHVLMGHGRPLPDLPATIAEWEAGLDAALTAVEAAVAERPAGAYELMERINGPAAGAADGPWLFGQIAAYLRHLRLAGRVTRCVDASGRFRYEPSSA